MMLPRPYKAIAVAVLLTPVLSVAANSACEGGSDICEEFWVAGQDVNRPHTFFKKNGRPVAANDIAAGDKLISQTNIHVRYPRVDRDEFTPKWGRTAFILKRGTPIVVSDTAWPSIRNRGSQIWLRIKPGDEISEASMPGPRGIEALATIHVQNGIWWEAPIAQATAGYDPEKNRTLINRYDAVVYGPTTVEQSIQRAVEICVALAGKAAYEVFTANPSPEISTRLGLATAAFYSKLGGCFAYSNIRALTIGQFRLGYVQRATWKDGMHLQFSGDNPVTQNYRRMHSFVRDKLPHPLNRAIEFYIATQEFPQLDIELHPPREFREFLQVLPKPDQLRAMYQDAEQRLGPLGRTLLTELKEQFENPQLEISEAAIGRLLKAAAVRLVGEEIQRFYQNAGQYADQAREGLARLARDAGAAADAIDRVTQWLPPTPVPTPPRCAPCAFTRVPPACPLDCITRGPLDPRRWFELNAVISLPANCVPRQQMRCDIFGCGPRCP